MGGTGPAGSESPRKPFDVEAQKKPKSQKDTSDPTPGNVVKAPPYAGPKLAASPSHTWEPASGQVKEEKGKEGLSFHIPAAGFYAARGGSSSPATILAFACLWLVCVLAILALVAMAGLTLIFAFAFIPFAALGLFLVALAVRNARLEEQLQITKKHFHLEKNLFGWKSVVEGSCADIVALDLKIQRQFQQVAGFIIRETKPCTWCYFIAGQREVNFGHFSTSPEQQHILKEISLFLRVPMGTGTLAPSAYV